MNSLFTEYSLAHVVMKDQSRNYCLKEWDKFIYKPLGSIHFFLLFLKKDWTRPTSLAKHLNLGECGFPGLNMCVAVDFLKGCLGVKGGVQRRA